MKASGWMLCGSIAAIMAGPACAAAAGPGGQGGEGPVPEAARVTRVLLVLTPSNMRYVRPRTYADMLDAGCRFGASPDPDRQGALLEIMRRHLVHSPQEGGFSTGFLRNAIELHLVDGAVLRYVFSDEYYRSGGSVYGWRDRKDGAGGVQPGTMPLVAGEGFLRELRDWAGGGGGRGNASPACLRALDAGAAQEKRALPGPLG